MSSSTPIHSESYRLEDVGQIPGTFQLVFDATRYNIIKDERHIVYQILTEFQIKHLAEVRVHPMHVCRSTSLPGLEALLDIDTKLLSYIIGE